MYVVVLRHDLKVETNTPIRPVNQTKQIDQHFTGTCTSIILSVPSPSNFQISLIEFVIPCQSESIILSVPCLPTCNFQIWVD